MQKAQGSNRPQKKARHANRGGMRIRGAQGDPEVRAAVIKCARWIRTQFEFPVRVHVYLEDGERIIEKDGSSGVAYFFGPFSRADEPFIKLATGDYKALRKEMSRDDALASILCSFFHEIIHYVQWVATGEFHERGVNRRATRLLRRYQRATDHP